MIGKDCQLVFPFFCPHWVGTCSHVAVLAIFLLKPSASLKPFYSFFGSHRRRVFLEPVWLSLSSLICNLRGRFLIFSQLVWLCYLCISPWKWAARTRLLAHPTALAEDLQLVSAELGTTMCFRTFFNIFFGSGQGTCQINNTSQHTFYDLSSPISFLGMVRNQGLFKQKKQPVGLFGRIEISRRGRLLVIF